MSHDFYGKKVQIGPFTWTISPNPPEDDLGGTDFETLTITIKDDPNLDPQVTKETLFHEIIHAVLLTTAYHRALTTEEEENMVGALSPLLFQAVQQIADDLK